MRKVATFLTASLALAWVAAPVVAQVNAPDQFKDVDTNHWAYQAMESLRAKNIVVGYPDGYFRGKRTLSRYEFAVALDRALKSLPTPEKGEPGAAGAAGEAGPAGPAGEAGPKGDPGISPEELATIQKLVGEFKNDLAGLGTSVSAIDAKLKKLAAEVAELQETVKKMKVITGGVFFGVRSDRATGNYIDKDGVVNPFGGGAGSSLTKNPVVVHTLALGFETPIAGGGTATVRLITDNYSNYVAGMPLAANTYIDQLSVNAPMEALGRESAITVGRFSHKMTDMIFAKPKYDSYFDNPWTDDGMYRLDGAKFDGKFGSVGVDAFAAKLSTVTGTNGLVVPFNTPAFAALGGTGIKPFGFANAAPVTLQQVGGISATLPVHQMGGGHVRLSLLAGSTAAGVPGLPTDVLVFGADAALKVNDRIGITADVTKSLPGTKKFETWNPYKNNAYNVGVNYAAEKLSVSAGYKYIDPLYYAPGYWGKIGNWFNPTNIQGPTVSAKYGVTPTVAVNVGGNFLWGARNMAGFGGLGVKDEITQVTAGVKWDVSKSFSTTVDWEGVYWALDGPTHGFLGNSHPTESYLTLGTGYNLTSSTILKLGYQIGEYNGRGSLLTPWGGSRYTYNALTSQVAVKF